MEKNFVGEFLLKTTEKVVLLGFEALIFYHFVFKENIFSVN